MERFIQQHQQHVCGVLAGFDRVLFKGTIVGLSYVNGLVDFLSRQRVLFQHFATFCQTLSQRIKDHADAMARSLRRPVRYLASPNAVKEDIARQIMIQDKISHGLVCVLSCVESCQSYEIRRDHRIGKPRLLSRQRKCLHLYFYFVDREFGLMHVRLQTWLPFTVQVCLNGREYLARRLDQLGIAYDKRDNCFTRIDNLPRAQALLDQLVGRRWERFLNRLARRVNPLVLRAAGLNLGSYYWTVRESEYATDVMFHNAAALQQVYRPLLDHALQQFGADDVLRFMGRDPRRYRGEITSEIKRGRDGVRIKHRVQENSIKMYDKQGSVLRIETTMNNPARFRVRRRVTRQGQPCLRWVPLRKGVADMARRVEIARAANERYLEALSVVGRPARSAAVLDPVSRPVVEHGRRYRGLRPISREEAALFRVVLRGEHQVQGVRNADVRRVLDPGAERDAERRRRMSGRATRCLRLLRAHGLMRKVSGTRYYRVTDKGHHVMTTALKLREIDLSRLAA